MAKTKSSAQLEKELEALAKKLNEKKQEIAVKKRRDREKKNQLTTAQKKQERTMENRRKYAMGGFILKKHKQDSGSGKTYTLDQLYAECMPTLKRTSDRVAFGLEPLPKVDE